VKEVAALLLKHRISAVPVVDEAGGLVGVVSEGDLLGRNDEDRERGQEWWLTLLSKRGEIETAVTEAAVVRPALDVMHTPVVTISQDAPLHEVAEMLRIYGIKRLPVVHDGRMVGIFSRADLLRVVEGIPDAPRAMHSTDGLTGMLMSFFGGTSRGEVASGDLPARPTGPEVSAPITADMFRHLGGASDQNKIDEKKMKAHVAELQRLRQVKTMLQDHDVVQVRVTLEARKPLAGAALARSSVTRRPQVSPHFG